MPTDRSAARRRRQPRPPPACGTGASRRPRRAGALVTGVDDDARRVDGARRRRPGLPWVHADAHALPPELRRGRFDLVYLGHGSLARHRATSTRGPAASRPRFGGRRPPAPRRAPGRRVPRRLRPLAGRLLRRRELGDDRDRRRARGLVLRGLEEWPGKDANVPGTSCLPQRSPTLRNACDRGHVPMGIVSQLLLIAAGAILTWGVTAEAEGLDVNAIGVILMIVGILGLVLSLIFWSSWGGFRRRATYVEGGPARPTAVPRRRETVVEEDVAPGPAASVALPPADERAGDVAGDVAGDLRVLLQPPERVLVPVAPERDVDPEPVTLARRSCRRAPAARRAASGTRSRSARALARRSAPARVDEPLVVRRDRRRSSRRRGAPRARARSSPAPASSSRNAIDSGSM